MKKIIGIVFSVMIAFGAIAQSNSVTFGAGLLNAKARIQYEHGFADMHSAGANLGYYFVNWTGPRVEGFYRIYFGGDNERGAFLQASAGAGSFTYAIEDITEEEYDLDGDGINEKFDIYKESGRWLTTGGGIAFGGKLTTRGGFVFESTVGYHFWTPPPAREYTDDYNEYEALVAGAADLGELLGYYVIGPGFPLHFQVKLGFNF